MIKVLKFIVTVSLAANLFMGCKSDEKPEGILSEREMTSFFLDIYEAESSITSLGMKRDTILVIFDKYEKMIFERHNISREQYKKSLTYYYDHPAELERIYEIMIDTLTLRESKIKAIQEAGRKKTDSLRNVKVPK